MKVSIQENTEKLIKVFQDIFKEQPLVQKFSTKTTYKTMPIMTDEVIGGIPLRSVIAPPIEGCDLDKQGYFDIFIENTLHGADLGRDLPGDLAVVARRLGVVGVICSLAQDRLWVKDGTMIAILDTLQFGIRANKIKSNFYDGKQFEIGNVYEKVAVSRTVETQRGNLCSALATVRCDATRQAERILLALKVGNPTFKYQDLIFDTMSNIPGSDAKLDEHRIFDICMQMRMPIRRLNIEFVPKLMSQEQFDATFTPEFKSKYRNWRDTDRAFLYNFVKGLTDGKLAVESRPRDA